MLPRICTRTQPALLLLAVLSVLAEAQQETEGPLAYVTLVERVEWVTARECAKTCLKYQGIWHCGVNGGYHDLAYDLDCGCSPINGCFCNPKLASSASSYISSCVSQGCGRVENLSEDVSAMVSIYDSYCTTAMIAGNEAQPTDDASGNDNANEPTPLPEKTTTPQTGKNGQGTAQTSATGGEATETADQAQGNPSTTKDGLSKSDMVALAASLGVGIPSLLLAALTLYFQMRKKKRNAAAEAARMSTMAHVTPAKPHTNGWDS